MAALWRAARKNARARATRGASAQNGAAAASRGINSAISGIKHPGIGKVCEEAAIENRSVTISAEEENEESVSMNNIEMTNNGEMW
jgi:hypothetical protein